MVKKYVLNLGLIVVLFVCLMAQAGAQGTKLSVVPGVGVGPVKLGMGYTEIGKLLHIDKDNDEHVVINKRPVWIYYKEGVDVGYDSNVRALQIYVNRPGIFTDKGIQVGDTKEKFIEAYGRGFISHEIPTAKGHPKQVHYVYKKLGLAFHLEAGIIKYIIVVDRHD